MTVILVLQRPSLAATRRAVGLSSWDPPPSFSKRSARADMTCMGVDQFTATMHVHVCMYACMHACMHACLMYVCTYVCMYVCPGLYLRLRVYTYMHKYETLHMYLSRYCKHSVCQITCYFTCECTYAHACVCVSFLDMCLNFALSRRYTQVHK